MVGGDVASLTANPCPKGAKHNSPGQRPGTRVPTPNLALKGPDKPGRRPVPVSPFQGIFPVGARFPGRCPGLICLGPFGARKPLPRPPVLNLSFPGTGTGFTQEPPGYDEEAIVPAGRRARNPDEPKRIMVACPSLGLRQGFSCGDDLRLRRPARSPARSRWANLPDATPIGGATSPTTGISARIRSIPLIIPASRVGRDQDTRRSSSGRYSRTASSPGRPPRGAR
jgi:hypothetical protein